MNIIINIVCSIVVYIVILCYIVNNFYSENKKINEAMNKMNESMNNKLKDYFKISNLKYYKRIENYDKLCKVVYETYHKSKKVDQGFYRSGVFNSACITVKVDNKTLCYHNDGRLYDYYDIHFENIKPEEAWIIIQKWVEKSLKENKKKHRRNK